jgi:hypothetical protein
MPFNGNFDTLVRTDRLEKLGETLFDVGLDKDFVYFLERDEAPGLYVQDPRLDPDAVAKEVREKVHGCNHALNLLYKIIASYDDFYCPNCGSCGEPGCCPAPRCKYFDVYKGSLGDSLTEALDDVKFWRDRAEAMHGLLERLQGWDMLHMVGGDGPYWRQEIEKVLGK